MDSKLITQMPAVDRDPDRIGTFHIEYSIQEWWDQTDVAEMGDWLAENCTNNYIFLHDTSTIIGGGCHPIKSRWMRYVKQRAKNIEPDLDADGIITIYRIRLSENDDVMFRLTWLSGL
jgi:hypothetical protein